MEGNIPGCSGVTEQVRRGAGWCLLLDGEVVSIEPFTGHAMICEKDSGMEIVAISLPAGTTGFDLPSFERVRTLKLVIHQHGADSAGAMVEWCRLCAGAAPASAPAPAGAFMFGALRGGAPRAGQPAGAAPAPVAKKAAEAKKATELKKVDEAAIKREKNETRQRFMLKADQPRANPKTEKMPGPLRALQEQNGSSMPREIVEKAAGEARDAIARADAQRKGDAPIKIRKPAGGVEENRERDALGPDDRYRPQGRRDPERTPEQAEVIERLEACLVRAEKGEAVHSCELAVPKARTERPTIRGCDAEVVQRYVAEYNDTRRIKGYRMDGFSIGMKEEFEDKMIYDLANASRLSPRLIRVVLYRAERQKRTAEVRPVDEVDGWDLMAAEKLYAEWEKKKTPQKLQAALGPFAG
jgi:hypothetical protein